MAKHLDFRAIGLFVASAIAAVMAMQSVYVAYAGPWDIAFGRNTLIGAAVVITLIMRPVYALGQTNKV